MAAEAEGINIYTLDAPSGGSAPIDPHSPYLEGSMKFNCVRTWQAFTFTESNYVVKLLCQAPGGLEAC